MTTRADIIREARGFEGTPFVHQGRLPGVGLDCIGVIVCAAERAGLDMVDHTAYSRQPNPRVLLDYIGRNFDEIPAEDAEAGDVVLFYWRSSRRHGPLPQHAGLLTRRPASPTGLGLLHAYDDLGRVLEVDFEESWAARVCSAWRYRGAA